MAESQFLQVTTTVDKEADAQRIATALVEKRLAACVQILGPIKSVYRWQGKVEQAIEWQCVAKTTRGLYADVEAAIRELHSYECPEIVAVKIAAGSAGYLEWLGRELGE